MDGQVGLESQPGSGSTFWVDLPLRVVEADQAAVAGQFARVDQPATVDRLAKANQPADQPKVDQPTASGRAAVAGQPLVVGRLAEEPLAAGRPAKGDQAGPGHVPAREGTDACLAGARVLVVDDSRINLDVSRRILEKAGASTTLCENGAEALACLRAYPEAFDLVLMDVQMPVMDGYEATRRIRDELGLNRLPVIALTAGALVTDREVAMEAGMTAFLTKPLDPASLAQALRRYLDLPSAAPESAALPPPSANPGPVSPASSAAALSWPVIPGLDDDWAREQFAGDRDFYQGLIGRFAERLEALLPELQTPCAPGDAELAKTLHQIRGLAGNLGARDLAASFWQLEEALQGGDAEPPPGLRAAALRQAESLLTAIATWRAGQPGPGPELVGDAEEPVQAWDDPRLLPPLMALEEALRLRRFDAKRTCQTIATLVAGGGTGPGLRPRGGGGRAVAFPGSLDTLTIPPSIHHHSG